MEQQIAFILRVIIVGHYGAPFKLLLLGCDGTCNSRARKSHYYFRVVRFYVVHEITEIFDLFE